MPAEPPQPEKILPGYEPQPPTRQGTTSGSGQGGLPPGEGPEQVHPSRSESNDRTWAIFAYLGNFILSLLAPLIIYLIKKNESRFVRYHAAQSLNMQVTYFIYEVIGVLLLVLIGPLGSAFLFSLFLVLIVSVGVAFIIYLIKAAIEANRGEFYRVPRWLCLPMVH